MNRVLEFLTDGSPWLIQQESLETILEVAQRQNDLEAVLSKRGEPLDNTYRVQVRDGVAIIPVTGPIVPRGNMFTHVSGLTSVQMLALDLAEAERNPNVRGVAFDFDTPGGHATLIQEFADQIRAFSKPTVAYVSGRAASGGYWLAAAADKIVMAKTGFVGSVGVVTSAYRVKDDSVIEFVSSNAPDKRPDIETDEGKKVVQTVVDDLEQVFIESVMNFRGLSREQVIDLRGGVVIGAKAIEAGFADEIGSLESVISQLQEENPMDLNQLQADHAEVYQAAVNVGKDEAKAEHETALASAKGEAVTAERTRISAIMSSEEATGRAKLAQHIAFSTDMTPEAAAQMLANAPKESASSGFDQMDQQLSQENPNIESDADVELSEEDKLVEQFKTAGEV